MVGRVTGSDFRPWSEAMERALYGPDGFYRARGGPAAHFRTSVHASPLFATAVIRLLRETDEALGRPQEIALVDVGAGRGELLESVRAQLTADHPTKHATKHATEHASDHATKQDAEHVTDHATEQDADHATDQKVDQHVERDADSADAPLIARLRLIAIEVADRPDNLASDIEWRNDLPAAGSVTGLLIANEWLDNVPCDVVQATPDGWRSVEVATDGTERLADAPDPGQQAWLCTWWPLDGPSGPDGAPAQDGAPEDSAPEDGLPENSVPADGVPEDGAPAHGAPADSLLARAEIGLSRDAAWHQAVAVLARGVAIAIDYAHVRTSRPLLGTLTGYAHGRQTVPVPDGSCDITAHVALDACAAAADAEWTVHSDQRAVFHSLGITGARPDLSLASRDPRGYLRALSQASAATELTDAAGLGGFGWLIQGVAVPIPPSLDQT